MQLTRFSARLPQGCAGRLGAILLTLSLLGCSQPAQKINRVHPAVSEPETTVVDFQLMDCEKIWDFVDDKVMSNPLYWLRTMDCGQRLSPADARAEARRWPADNWQSTFKQAVLMDNGNVTPMERRQYVQRLDGYSYDYPAPVRPLLLLWREGQASQLQLAEERMRYARLQQSSDAQLDALRQRQIAANEELTITRRKLDNLTDIERQLSSRRSPDAAEGAHGVKPDASASDDPQPADQPSQDDANP